MRRRRSGTSKNGCRSKLEARIWESVKKRDPYATYESCTLEYISRYKPDVVLGNNLIIEIKGYFPSEDRTKMKRVKQNNPQYDIRIVFGNPHNKIRKGSKTTYAMWAEKHGFQWAAGDVPQAWIEEDTTNASN